MIEVSDASLAYDRTVKLALYARAGIAQYVVVNLREEVLEAHEGPAATEPRYASARRVARGDRSILRTGEGEGIEIEAGRLLPPPPR